jgi:hypothetical protein
MDDVQKLFREVADLDAEARSQYFADNGIDADLRREVESLLRFDRGSSDHLKNVVGATVDNFLDSALDRFCGPYELGRVHTIKTIGW